MTQVLRGRGGSVNRPSNSSWKTILGAFGLALVFAGCGLGQGTRALPGSASGQAQGGAAGLGQEGIGASKSSLAEFQKGTLGPGASGPLHDIHFAYDDYTIQPQDGSLLTANAGWLKSHQNNRVQVEGHCDERGSAEYNLALGARRAQAAKDYLVTLGIAANRISTISYGKELPLCTEHAESCWAQNRRAHFVVLK